MQAFASSRGEAPRRLSAAQANNTDWYPAVWSHTKTGQHAQLRLLDPPFVVLHVQALPDIIAWSRASDPA
jgi:hypothetical protein